MTNCNKCNAEMVLNPIAEELKGKYYGTDLIIDDGKRVFAKDKVKEAIKELLVLIGNDDIDISAKGTVMEINRIFRKELCSEESE